MKYATAPLYVTIKYGAVFTQGFQKNNPFTDKVMEPKDYTQLDYQIFS